MAEAVKPTPSQSAHKGTCHCTCLVDLSPVLAADHFYHLYANVEPIFDQVNSHSLLLMSWAAII
jgi:hypothetical protein